LHSMQRGSPLKAVERRSLSTGAAARRAGCHPTTVLRAIDRGELPAHRLGSHGHYRIAPEQLEAWLLPTQPKDTA
jgi:excisionase family DNA binding protein